MSRVYIAMDQRREELDAIGRLLTDEIEVGPALGRSRATWSRSIRYRSQPEHGCRRLAAFPARSIPTTFGGSVAACRPLAVAWSESGLGWRADAADGFRRLQRLGNLHGSLKPLSDAGLHRGSGAAPHGEVSAFDALAAFERGLPGRALIVHGTRVPSTASMPNLTTSVFTASRPLTPAGERLKASVIRISLRAGRPLPLALLPDR